MTTPEPARAANPGPNTPGQSQGNVRLAITSRQQMQEDVSYSLCANDPQILCQTAANGG